MNETNPVQLANIRNNLTLALLLPVKIFLILSTVFLNLFIIYIFGIKIKKKTYSNALFLSKSVADAIVGASSMSWMTVFTSEGYWPLGYALCAFWIIFDFASCTISLFHLLLITWHRYRQLTRPFDVTEDLSLMCYVKMAISWLLPLIYFGVSVLIITEENFESSNCYFTSTFTYVLLSDLFAYTIPVLLLVILNFMTYRALKAKSKRISHGVTSVRATTNVAAAAAGGTTVDDEIVNNSIQIQRKKFQATKPMQKDRKAVTCLAVVSILMILCWIIFLITWPIMAACACVDAILYEIGYWLTYISSTVYPISLLIFHESIKKNFLRIFKRK